MHYSSFHSHNLIIVQSMYAASNRHHTVRDRASRRGEERAYKVSGLLSSGRFNFAICVKSISPPSTTFQSFFTSTEGSLALVCTWFGCCRHQNTCKHTHTHTHTHTHSHTCAHTHTHTRVRTHTLTHTHARTHTHTHTSYSVTSIIIATANTHKESDRFVVSCILASPLSTYTDNERSR